MFDSFQGGEGTVTVSPKQPVRAFDRLDLHRGRARPWLGSREWVTDSTLSAHCESGHPFGGLAARPHAAPGPHCRCGIGGRDASWVPEDDRLRGKNVVAAFAALELHGTVRVTPTGFRAEAGRITAVALAPRQPRWQIAAVRAFAVRGGISVVHAAELTDIAESGDVIRGADLLDALPERTPISLAVDDDTAPPHFRFIFGPTAGRVLHAPYGGVPRFVTGEPAAVGDIVARDRDSAVATFAHVDPPSRSRAEAELRRWAFADGWQLEIKPGLRPLGPLPPKAYPDSRTILCTHCGDSAWVSAVVGPHWVQRPFHHTRCGRCGVGRRFPANVSLPGRR